MNSDVHADCTRLCKEIWSEDYESADSGEKSWQGWCCAHGMLQMTEDISTLIVYFPEDFVVFIMFPFDDSVQYFVICVACLLLVFATLLAICSVI